jgi:hypothetical protein
MSKPIWIAILFYVSALYDGALGIIFLLFPSAPFRWFEVTPPNHFGYVQFPAALLIIFALLFIMIARNPVANRKLIPFGMLLKVSYCGVVFYHWLAAGIPGMWKPFAWIDLLFLVLFIIAYFQLKPQTNQT